MIVLVHVILLCQESKILGENQGSIQNKVLQNFDIQSLRPIKRRYFQARETVRDWSAIFALDSYHLPPLKVKGQPVQGQQLTNQTKEQYSERENIEAFLDSTFLQ